MRSAALILLGAVLVVSGRARASDGAAVVELPPLVIDGVVASAHTQGLWIDDGVVEDGVVDDGVYWVTARRDDVSPRRALLLRTRETRDSWDAWDITPDATGDAQLDHPGGLDSDGSRLWIPIAESRRGGRTLVRAYEIASLRPGDRPRARAEFPVDDHIGALAVAPSGVELRGATWDTTDVLVWSLDGRQTARLDRDVLRGARLGVDPAVPARSGLAVQDWTFHGDRMVASGILKGSDAAAEPPRSRLLVIGGAGDSLAVETEVILPRPFGVELGREGMAIDGDDVVFLPEDLGETNRAYRLRLVGLLRRSPDVTGTPDLPPDLPPVGELPSIREFPDPFLMADGVRVSTTADWRLRREEIASMAQYFEYGSLPPPPGNVVARTVASRDGGETDLRLRFGPGHGVSMRVRIRRPASGAGPFPVVIQNVGRLVDTPRAAGLVEHGFMVCDYVREDLDPDRRGVIGQAQATWPEHDWGTLAVWAWGAMRVVDYLLTRDDVDPARIAITGHSRGGKAALLAGALDERIALTAPNGSGAGGAGSYRVLGPRPETLEAITETSRFAYWFHPRLRSFRGRVDRLPLDQHFLVALVAPRAFISTDAFGDLWANPTGTQATHLAAREVYRFLGARERIGIAMREGRHDQNAEDWRALLEFLRQQFHGAAPAGGRRFDELPLGDTAPPFSWRAPEPADAERRGERTASIAARHVTVFRARGRFGGWPANHGIWSWGNEIVVGFGVGQFRDLGPRRHAIDRERPEEHWLARSLDGGETWSLEHPGERGFLVPRGEALHGTVPEYLDGPEPRDCPGGIDFTAPGFALTLRMTDNHGGPSLFHYSLDRCRTWRGPFRFPNLGTPGIAARTDYLVNGPRDCTVFLTAAKANSREGRPLCARTTDGGASWRLVSFIGSEPSGFSIMPSTVRLSPTVLVTAVRRRDGPRRWIEAWRSEDDGATWQPLGDIATTGEGNPPSLIRLADGRLCLTYGHRAPPFGIRARLSDDGGRTWGRTIALRNDGGGRDVGYPRSVQRPDGRVVTVYYFHRAPRGDRGIEATIWSP